MPNPMNDIFMSSPVGMYGPTLASNPQPTPSPMQQSQTADTVVQSYGGQYPVADAGFVPATTQKNMVLPPAPQDGVVKAMEQQQAAQLMAAQAQQAPAVPQEYQNQMARAEQEAATQQKAIADAYQQQKDRTLSEYKDLSSQYAERKIIDPMDKWGTDRKIGAAISIALGAMGSALTGQKNAALEIITNAIDRDIALQKADIERLGAAAKDKRMLVAELKDKYQDDLQATNMAKAVAIGKVQEKINAVAAASKNKAAIANAMKTVADLEVQKQQYLAKKSEGTTSKLTEKQYAADTSSKAMAFANDNLEKLTEYASTVGAGIQGAVPYALRTEDRQMLDTARTQFTEAYMRYASGAAIADNEIQRTLESALPRVGESKKIQETKAQFRRDLINNIAAVSTGKITEMEFAQRTSREQAARFGAKPK